MKYTKDGLCMPPPFPIDWMWW